MLFYIELWYKALCSTKHSAFQPVSNFVEKPANYMKAKGIMNSQTVKQSQVVVNKGFAGRPPPPKPAHPPATFESYYS